MKSAPFILFTALAASSAHALVTIDTVYVGDVGNPADPATRFGSVGYGYYVGTYEVTNAQYAEFLNAKAASDPYGLYNPEMARSIGGITRSGGDGRFVYTATNPNTPVSSVSFWDAARFTNWLTNGQGSGDTETGVYVLTPTGLSNNTVTRDATAWNAGGVAIASEDEWYKAAYYSGSPTGADGDGYWAYPTQSNSVPSNDLINPDPGNNANFSDAGDYTDPVNFLTQVGEFENSASHYGTYDQGGNVWEWVDASANADRLVLGGGFVTSEDLLNSSARIGFRPTSEFPFFGFRVTSLNPIPEPSTYAAVLGALALAAVAWRRR